MPLVNRSATRWRKGGMFVLHLYFVCVLHNLGRGKSHSNAWLGTEAVQHVRMSRNNGYKAHQA